MIEFFLWGALILGQSLYWSFFKDQTEVVSDQYWEAHSLRFRITRVASQILVGNGGDNRPEVLSLR
jgi:hypothetical protein